MLQLLQEMETENPEGNRRKSFEPSVNMRKWNAHFTFCQYLYFKNSTYRIDLLSLGQVRWRVLSKMEAM